MPRKRVVQSGKTTRKWGVNNANEVTRKRKDGSTYTEWRVAYYAQTPYCDENGVVVGFERKRKYACSTASGPEASSLAKQREEASKADEEAFWRHRNAERGEFIIREPEIPQAPQRRSIEEVVKEMMRVRLRYEDGEVVGLRHSYARKIRNYLGHLQQSPLTHRPMDTLSLLVISEWFASFMTSHAESTSARFKSFLVQAGKWALDNRYWERNLFERLPEVSMRPSAESERVFTFAEIDAMWNSARTPQEKALLVLLRCGLRQGECLGLTEANIISDHKIQVHYSLGEADNQWDSKGRGGIKKKYVDFLGKPKTRSSRTHVHIPREWMPYLKASLSLSESCSIPAFDDESGPRLHKFVLGNRFGFFWREWAASRCLKRLMQRAGIALGKNESTFHAWRHTFCTDLVALGANDIELGYLMRHSDANLSKTVYATARQEHLTIISKYRGLIDNLTDYVDVIAQMDLERRMLGLTVWSQQSQVEKLKPSHSEKM